MITALRAATHYDSPLPTGDEVKAVIVNATEKLAKADGAQIVDFSDPAKAPISSKNNVITGLEVERTPAVVGFTSRNLLRYAASL